MSMTLRRIGQSDLEVSEICLGTMTFGEQNDLTEAHAQLDQAVSAGVNFIDTAEMYPVPPRRETQGETERMVGSWLARQPRDRLVIATKVTGPARGFDWIRGGPRITPAQIEKAVEGSLRRLRTDYLDLYQIHWPDRYVPMFGERHFVPERCRETESIEVQLEALDRLVRSGKVRYLGLSNETPWGVMRFLQVADAGSRARVVSVQNAYHLLNRSFETGGLAEVCHYQGVSLLPYSPLAFGLLSGKYLDSKPADARLSRFPGFGRRYAGPQVAEAVRAYVELAREHDLDPAQMAIAFALQQPATASVIVGATTCAQLASNLDARRLQLSSELLAAIDGIHARFPDPAP
ncbi:MAG: aldo/keto reductase [Halothiobacillaceae bacterium]